MKRNGIIGLIGAVAFGSLAIAPLSVVATQSVATNHYNPKTVAQNTNIQSQSVSSVSWGTFTLSSSVAQILQISESDTSASYVTSGEFNLIILSDYIENLYINGDKQTLVNNEFHQFYDEDWTKNQTIRVQIDFTQTSGFDDFNGSILMINHMLQPSFINGDGTQITPVNTLLSTSDENSQVVCGLSESNKIEGQDFATGCSDNCISSAILTTCNSTGTKTGVTTDGTSLDTPAISTNGYYILDMTDAVGQLGTIYMMVGEGSFVSYGSTDQGKETKAKAQYYDPDYYTDDYINGIDYKLINELIEDSATGPLPPETHTPSVGVGIGVALGIVAGIAGISVGAYFGVRAYRKKHSEVLNKNTSKRQANMKAKSQGTTTEAKEVVKDNQSTPESKEVAENAQKPAKNKKLTEEEAEKGFEEEASQEENPVQSQDRAQNQTKSPDSGQNENKEQTDESK